MVTGQHSFLLVLLYFTHYHFFTFVIKRVSRMFYTVEAMFVYRLSRRWEKT